MSLKSQIQFPGVQMSCGMISRRLFNLSVPHSVFHPGKQGLCYWLPLEFGLLLLHENIYVSIHWETIRTWKNRTISTKGRFCQSHTEMHRRTQKESLRQWSLKESLWHPTPQTTGLNQSEKQDLQMLDVQVIVYRARKTKAPLQTCNPYQYCYFTSVLNFSTHFFFPLPLSLSPFLLSAQAGLILMGILLPQIKYKYLMAWAVH